MKRLIWIATIFLLLPFTFADTGDQNINITYPTANTGANSNAFQGIEIHPNQSAYITNCSKSGLANPTRCYVVNGSGVVLGNKTFTGNTAFFENATSPGVLVNNNTNSTYYIVVGSDGAAFTEAYSDEFLCNTFPRLQNKSVLRNSTRSDNMVTFSFYGLCPNNQRIQSIASFYMKDVTAAAAATPNLTITAKDAYNQAALTSFNATLTQGSNSYAYGTNNGTITITDRTNGMHNISIYGNNSFGSYFTEAYYNINISGQEFIGNITQAYIKVILRDGINNSLNHSSYNVTLNGTIYSVGSSDVVKNITGGKFNITIKKDGYVRVNKTVDITGLFNGTLVIDTVTDIDSCTTYEFATINWSFYTFTGYRTTADHRVLVNCNVTTSLGVNVNKTFDFDTVYGSQLCMANRGDSFLCTIDSYWNVDINADFLYHTTYNFLTLNNVTKYYNLTVTPLSINFSDYTQGYVVTQSETSPNGSSYFNDTNILIYNGVLPEGKVSVVFNNGTQFYEYDNDFYTTVRESMRVISNPDTYINIRAQDNLFTILPETAIRIYEVRKGNITGNASVLTHRLYGNTEKKIALRSGNEYVARATLSGYEQENGFLIFKPEEFITDDMVITMIQPSGDDEVNYEISDLQMIWNGTGNSKSIQVNISRDTLIDEVEVLWYINSTNGLQYTDTRVNHFSVSRTFTQGDGEHEIYIYLNDRLVKRFIILEYRIDSDEDRLNLRTSKAAFIVMFLFLVAGAGAIQAKFQKYGIESFMGLSIVFSFMNYYIIVIAVISMLGYFSKQYFVGGDK